MPQQPRVLVTGAGGFIGHHLTNYLVDRGYWVRGVDIKRPEFEATRADEFLLLDLTSADNCLQVGGDDPMVKKCAEMCKTCAGSCERMSGKKAA